MQVVVPTIKDKLKKKEEENKHQVLVSEKGLICSWNTYRIIH